MLGIMGGAEQAGNVLHQNPASSTRSLPRGWTGSLCPLAFGDKDKASPTHLTRDWGDSVRPKPQHKTAIIPSSGKELLSPGAAPGMDAAPRITGLVSK